MAGGNQLTCSIQTIVRLKRIQRKRKELFVRNRSKLVRRPEIRVINANKYAFRESGVSNFAK